MEQYEKEKFAENCLDNFERHGGIFHDYLDDRADAPIK